jgi:hypothetical protein
MSESAQNFDGCNRKCRTAGAHTLRWGSCEHAPEPEPRVSFLRVRRMPDGLNSTVTESLSGPELAARIETALRTIPITLGPNALAVLQRGETVQLSGGEYWNMAMAAAQALIAGEEAP